MGAASGHRGLRSQSDHAQHANKLQIGHPCMADVVDYLYANNYMSETDYTLAEFQERLYVSGGFL